MDTSRARRGNYLLSGAPKNWIVALMLGNTNRLHVLSSQDVERAVSLML